VHRPRCILFPLISLVHIYCLRTSYNIMRPYHKRARLHDVTIPSFFTLFAAGEEKTPVSLEFTRKSDEETCSYTVTLNRDGGPLPKLVCQSKDSKQNDCAIGCYRCRSVQRQLADRLLLCMLRFVQPRNRGSSLPPTDSHSARLYGTSSGSQPALYGSQRSETAPPMWGAFLAF
jgi:hypothetical protein